MATFAGINLGQIQSESAPYVTNIISFTVPGSASSDTESFALDGGGREISITGIYTDNDEAATLVEAWVKLINDEVDNQVTGITTTFSYVSDRLIASDATKTFTVQIIKFEPTFEASNINSIRYSLQLREAA